ncbi:MAG: NINE protein [Propioniciclava sp.]
MSQEDPGPQFQDPSAGELRQSQLEPDSGPPFPQTPYVAPESPYQAVTDALDRPTPPPEPFAHHPYPGAEATVSYPQPFDASPVPLSGPEPFPYVPPAAGYPVAPYGASPDAPYGIHPQTGIPYSNKSKVVAGVLQIFLGGFGAGRFYLGDGGIGVAQLIVTFLTFGFGGLWPLIDGIVILAGNPRDRYGRPLRP